MTMIQETCVQTLRFLAADEVEKAKSGHPGFPLGTAPLRATVRRCCTPCCIWPVTKLP